MQPAADEMAEALPPVDHRRSPRSRWWPTSPPGRCTIPERSGRSWSSRSPAGCAGARASSWLAGEGGVTRFAEAGAGKVLTGMAKRIAPDAEAVALNAPADLEAFAKSL